MADPVQNPALQQAQVLDQAAGIPTSNAAPLPKLGRVPGAGPVPQDSSQSAPAPVTAAAPDSSGDTGGSPGATPPKFEDTQPVDEPPPKFEDTQPIADSNPAPPDNSAMKDYVSRNLQVYNAANAGKAPDSGSEQAKTPTEAKSFYDAFKAGLQISTAGLAIRGEMPDTVLPEHSDRAFQIANQIGILAGDMPAMVAGGIMGATGGALAGTVEAPVVGTVAGAAVGGGAGAFALPAALRKIMIDHYEKGDIKTAGEFVNRLSATTWEAIKGGVTGAATSIAGPLAGELGPAVVAPLAKIGAELATMTTVGAAMEGHLPSSDDFINGALVIGGLHGVGVVAPKLRNIFAATGEKPADVLERAQSDVEFKQQLLSDNPKLPEQAQPSSIEYSSVPIDKESASKLLSDQVEKNGTPPPEEQPGPAKLVPAEEDLPVQPKAEEIPGRTDAENKILSMVGESDEPTEKTFKQSWQDFYAKNIDYLDPINSAIEEARRNGAQIPSEDDAYEKGRLFAAHMDKVRSFLEFGTRDATTGEINGEGLNQIYQDIPKIENADGKMVPDLDGYRAYGIAQRGLELIDRGINPGKSFDPEAAKQVIADGADKFEPINRRRIDFQNRIIDYAADKGLFTDDAVKQMKALNEQHIPFNRVQEADVFTGKVPGGATIKKIYGSEKNILDPILQTYKNVEMLVKRAEINDVRQSFVQNMRDGDLIDKGEPYREDNAKYLRPVPIDEAPAPGSERDNQIAVYEAGKRTVYEGPPGVIDTLKRLDGDRTATDIWSKIMSKFATATRVGTVFNPAFGFAHFFRSQIMSGVYSKTGVIPFYDSARSLGDFMNKSPAYQDWLYNGGASSSWFKLDSQYMDNAEITSADNSKAPFWGKAWNAIHSAGEATEAFIKLTDNLSRFSEYKKTLEQGGSKAEAAFNSREIVPDYQKVGLQRSVLRSGVAFIGAHINSIDRMVQSFQDDFKGTVAKMSALSAISAMAWVANRNDDAIDALPDWQKNTYWNLNVSRMFGGSKDEPAYILRLPKPWAPGIMFGSGVEVALDAFFKDHPNQIQHFAESVAHSVVPEPIPNILQPVLDQYSNKQMFTGRPLVSEDKEKLLPELQYEPYTSETAKQIAKVIGYVPLAKDIGPNSDRLSSPAVVENYIHGWGGTLGGWALRLGDAGLRSAGVGNPQAHSADTIADAPFVNQFISRYPNFKDQNIQDFYENKNKTDEILNSIRYASKNGDMDAAVRIAQQNPDMEIRLDGISKGISTAKKTIQAIEDNATITPVEKRQLIDTMLFQVGSMARMGNKMMSEFQKAAKSKNQQPATTDAAVGGP